MKQLATSYVFNKTAKTVTLNNFDFPLNHLLVIINATRQQIIYNLANPVLGASSYVQGTNSVVTLEATLDPLTENTDALTIFYDNGVTSNVVLVQGPVGPVGPVGPAGVAPLSDAAPLALGASASPGTSPNASREDHVHARPTPADIGAATAAQVIDLQFALSGKDIINYYQLGADIDGEAAEDYSGTSVSLNAAGDIVAIGALYNNGNGIDSGHVRVYKWNGSAWVQQGVDIDGEAAGDQSGRSVSLNAAGDIVAIGANGNGAGHVRVYKWNGSAWVQQGADIDGENSLDSSGRSVSLNAAGDIVAIGANGIDSGHVRIYKWNGSAWVQQGADIDGEAAGDQSGRSVSLNAAGDIVAIGALYNNNGNGIDSGHVRIYKWNGSAWVQQGADIDGEAAGDNSGCSVSLNAAGDIVAIGALTNDGNGSNSGHVRVYKWNGSAWVQQGADIDGENSLDDSGRSVSLNAAGDIVAIGANGNGAGHVRVYKWNGSAWVQQGADIDGENSFDNSGWSVSLNAAGDIVAIGAHRNDGNGSNSGHVRVYTKTSNFKGSNGTAAGTAGLVPAPAATDNTKFLKGDGTWADTPSASPNSLSIGTVQTGAAGSSASASITGTAPSQTLSLTIPRGDKGDTGNAGTNGTAVLSGAGNPQGTQGAIGDFYINTSTNFIFGPKVSANSWPAGVSLVGPQGPAPAGTGLVSVTNGVYDTPQTVAQRNLVLTTDPRLSDARTPSAKIFRIRKTSGEFNFPSGSATALLFDTTPVINTDPSVFAHEVASGGGNSKIRISENGVYLVNTKINCSNYNYSGYAAIDFWITTGVLTSAAVPYERVVGLRTAANEGAADTILLNATGTIEVISNPSSPTWISVVWHRSALNGSVGTVVYNSNFEPFLEIIKLR